MSIYPVLDRTTSGFPKSALSQPQKKSASAYHSRLLLPSGLKIIPLPTVALRYFPILRTTLLYDSLELIQNLATWCVAMDISGFDMPYKYVSNHIAW